jgi:hypothetical protein
MINSNNQTICEHGFQKKSDKPKELKFKIFNLLMRGCLFELEMEAHEFHPI